VLIFDIQLDYVAKHVELSRHDAVPDHITEELAASYVKPGRRQYDPYEGPTVMVLHNAKAKHAKHVVCFPMGELGQHLSMSTLKGCPDNAQSYLPFCRSPSIGVIR